MSALLLALKTFCAKQEGQDVVSFMAEKFGLCILRTCAININSPNIESHGNPLE